MVSIDPRRVYVSSPEEIPFKTIKVRDPGMSLFYSCLLSVVKNNHSNVYLGPNGEEYVWYQCTVYVFHIYFNCITFAHLRRLSQSYPCGIFLQVNGGREGRSIGAYELAQAVEELGAGEILLNCIDCDSNRLHLTTYYASNVT